MRFAVLASPDSFYLRDLQRAAGSGDEVLPLQFSDIQVRLSGTAPSHGTSADEAVDIEKPLEVLSRSADLPTSWRDFDAVVVRTMPPGSLEQVVFRMDALGQYEATGGVVVNPTRAIEVAVDKFLTSARLQSAGLDTPRTAVCQTVEEAMEAFEWLGGDVVLKPLFGSEGRGITRLNDRDLARRACQLLAQLGAVLYLQEFVAHDGYDLRLMIVGDELFAMRRRNPFDWRTNVSRGAQAEPFQPTAAMEEMARRATRAVGAWVAGVDLLPARDGRLLALEVNAVPGWKALARVTGVDIAERVWQFVRRQVHRGTAHAS